MTDTKIPAKVKSVPLMVATANIDGIYAPGKTFAPDSIEQHDELLELGAARPATAEEVAAFGKD